MSKAEEGCCCHAGCYLIAYACECPPDDSHPDGYVTCEEAIDRLGPNATAVIRKGGLCYVIIDTSEEPEPSKPDGPDLSGFEIIAEGTNDCTLCCDGACCTGNQDCSVTTEQDCIESPGGGTWLGPGTDCSPNPCLTGACCDEEGDCTVATEEDCTGGGGTYKGDGTGCEPNICVGVCCDEEGDCTVDTEANCAGAYGGDGTDCDGPNPCKGACCEDCGITCTETTEDLCEGEFMGGGTECDPSPCVQTCGCCDGCPTSMVVQVEIENPLADDGCGSFHPEHVCFDGCQNTCGPECPERCDVDFSFIMNRSGCGYSGSGNTGGGGICGHAGGAATAASVGCVVVGENMYWRYNASAGMEWNRGAAIPPPCAQHCTCYGCCGNMSIGTINVPRASLCPPPGEFEFSMTSDCGDPTEGCSMSGTVSIG